MESYLHSFKGDLMQSIWQHGKRMFKPTILIGIVMFLITGALSFFLFSSMFGGDFGFFAELMSGNPLENQRILEERMQDYASDPFSMMRTMSWFFIGILLIQSFVYTLMLKMSGNIAAGEGSSLGMAFSKVKFKHLLLIILYFLVIGVIYFVLAMIMGLILAATHPALAIVLIPLLILVMVRFTNVVPAIVLGDKSFGDAMSFSWTTITFKRAAYIVLGVIVLAIVSVLALLLVGYLFGLLGTVGVGLMIVMQIGLQIFSLALGVSFLTAIYYRYAIVEGDDTMVDAIGTE